MELTGRYAKLRDDVIAALEVGREAERANPDDGGAYNFDSASIKLPRWKKALVEQALREAGTRGWVWFSYGGSRWVISPDTRGHCNARSRNSEAMTRALSEMGYDAFEYCALD